MAEETASAEETVTTVEWGSPAVERADRARHWAPRMRLAAPRTSVAWACAAVGFALALAAQVLPWAAVPLLSPNFDNGPVTTSAPEDVGLELLGSSPLVIVYEVVWPALFALVAAAFVVGRRRRRVLCAAGLGVAAGQLTVLAGLWRAFQNPGTNVGLGSGLVRLQLTHTGYAPGIYCAVAAVLLVALALAFGGVVPRRAAPEAVDLDDEADVPPDLTVTPLEPYVPEGDWDRPRDIDVRPGGSGG